ncbi:Outer membrane usher protein fimD precursor [Leminorella grimontii]|nr:Outer membrane usher protein fimD precursor [Leminorella grimontii]
MALGLGKNMGWVGAVSVDMTDAKAELRDRASERGQSWRLRYSKNFVDTGTNFSLAGYRYSTSGFYTLQEGLDSYNNRYDINDSSYDHKKSRSELLLSQRLWDNGGSLSVSLSNEEYWNNGRHVRSASLGYNNSWKSANYGINYTYSQNRSDTTTDDSTDDHLFSFNVSIPIDSLLSNSYANYSLNSSRNGKTVNTVGINGTMLARNNLSYSVSQGYTDGGDGATGNAGLNFKGGYGEASVAYSYDQNMQRVNYGLRGGVVAHADGITLSQAFGETAVLVKAPLASDVRVMNGVGISTDWRGYTVVPYVSPYRKTPITLDTASLKDNVDMTLTSQMVIPTRGAMVRAEFSPNVGLRMLISLTRENGDAVPFGSVASLQSEKANSAIVGDGGDVFMTGMPEQGRFIVKWGNDASQQCNVVYQASQAQEAAGIYRLSTVCL